MTEEWKAVVGWEGLYEVSSYGRVRSLDRIVEQLGRGGKPMQRLQPGRILAAGIDNRGYRMAGLTCDGETQRLAVHHLVLIAFVGSRPPGAITDHINGVRHDNRPANLRWTDYRANARNRHRPRHDNPHVGVDFRGRRAKPWRAKSTDAAGRSRHLGYFDTSEEATAAYLTFKAQHFDAQA